MKKKLLLVIVTLIISTNSIFAESELSVGVYSSKLEWGSPKVLFQVVTGQKGHSFEEIFNLLFMYESSSSNIGINTIYEDGIFQYQLKLFTPIVTLDEFKLNYLLLYPSVGVELPISNVDIGISLGVMNSLYTLDNLPFVCLSSNLDINFDNFIVQFDLSSITLFEYALSNPLTDYGFIMWGVSCLYKI